MAARIRNISPATLMTLSDAAFADLVNQDLRGTRHGQPADPDLHEALRSDDVIDRFVAHLGAIYRRAEGDLATRNAEVEGAEQEVVRLQRDPAALPEEVAAAVARVERLTEAYDRWRPGVVRFKTGLETDLRLARARQEQVARSRINPRDVERMRRRIGGLERAILDHKAATTDPTDTDRALWAIMDS